MIPHPGGLLPQAVDAFSGPAAHLTGMRECSKLNIRPPLAPSFNASKLFAVRSRQAAQNRRSGLRLSP